MLSRMETRKLLAFDLDQTIVTEANEVPAPILDAISRARAAGHLVAVLTGRPLAAAQPILDQLGLSSHYSVNHGALVIGDPGDVLRHTRMPWSDVTAVLGPERDTSLEYSCVVDDTLYVRNPGDDRWSWVHSRNRFVAQFRMDLNLEADKVIFSSDADPYDPERNRAYGQAEDLETEILNSFPHLVTYLWGNGYLEVTGQNSDKGTALEILSRQLGVHQRDTIAFGDGLNDLSMFQWAGYSVAVGPHAHQRVLAIASEHVAPPEEGGVSSWLEHNLGI